MTKVIATAAAVLSAAAFARLSADYLAEFGSVRSENHSSAFHLVTSFVEFSK